MNQFVVTHHWHHGGKTGVSGHCPIRTDLSAEQFAERYDPTGVRTGWVEINTLEDWFSKYAEEWK